MNVRFKVSSSLYIYLFPYMSYEINSAEISVHD